MEFIWNARVLNSLVNNALAFWTFTLTSKALFPCCEIRQPPIPTSFFLLLFSPFLRFCYLLRKCCSDANPCFCFWLYSTTSPWLFSSSSSVLLVCLSTSLSVFLSLSVYPSVYLSVMICLSLIIRSWFFLWFCPNLSPLTFPDINVEELKKWKVMEICCVCDYPQM